ncbi:MAG TPA: hypothetical protein VEX87_24070 [Skermanella sp.]|nr:hypothetical protein [Skermanella sp.]
MLAAYLPKDTDELAQFTVTACVAYILIAYLIWGIKCWKRRVSLPMDYVARIFDAVTFTSSSLAIASIFDKGIIPLLGDLRMFLIIAGLCGGAYSLHALFKA